MPIITSFLACLFILNLELFGVNSGIIFLAAAALIRFLHKPHLNLSFDHSDLITLFSISTLIVYVCTQSIFAGQIVPEFHAKPFRLLLTFVFLSVLFYRQSKSQLLIYCILLASSLNSLTLLIQYLGSYLNVDGMADFMNRLSPAANPSPYRKSGLMTGYPTAGMVGLFGFFILLVKPSVIQNKFLRLGTLSLLFLGVLLTSRAVLLILIVCFVIFSLNKVRDPKYFFKLLLGVTAMALFIGAVVDQHTMKTLRFMFEYLTNYLESGQIYVKSADSLINKHYHLPNDSVVLLFGNAEPIWSTLGAQSDVFFIRAIYSIGLIGMMLMLFVFFTVFALTLFNSKVSADRTITLLVSCSVLIMSFKGSYVLASSIWDICLLLYFHTKINK